ncbi:MAG: pyrroline-5-carboxylate reductase [Nitrososphaerota archaeon]|jgi:pyrroline-5-carboxylate reductase|uniref:pyrroline-5-carboxylate reductase n=1 Tax=Candidatus Bathycorpusculum sp. TaxID=2994959 RepID=UPI0028345DC8|nr:pyrroline-5-carboxylate reductase [Candidatus Termitimicrobium sp.]MCL2431788.1 pyrroline-5-carboxylate reductase [Candidatus Termitimicrobium sp.]MDR0493389.1 pyrroline-5-carboxylate reductase [Nitrososphaerota archaeon]
MSEKITVIGSGMMGNAIIKSLLKSNIAPSSLTAVDIQAEKLTEFKTLGTKISTDNTKAAKEATIIFVIVKPGDVAKVLNDIKDESKGKLIISAAATVPLNYLKKYAPESKIVRIMPNLCAMVQAAYTAYCCTENLTPQDKETIKNLLNMMGTCDEVEEKYMDAITAVSGSGPGYLSIIIEALTYAGLKVGLPRNIALNCAAQTVLGTGKLVVDLHEDPAHIKDMTTTPGGTTIEAIYQIEQSQIRPAMIRAIEEATKKSQTIREKLNLQ